MSYIGQEYKVQEGNSSRDLYAQNMKEKPVNTQVSAESYLPTGGNAQYMQAAAAPMRPYHADVKYLG